MKSIKYLMAALCISAVFAVGCSDDNNPNTANKGKAKPAVSAELGDTTVNDFYVTIKPSAEAKYYGCAIYEGASNSAPTALQIMEDETTGSIYKNLFSSADSTKATIKIDCTKSEYYQVFYVGINENGLLGDVKTLDIYIKGARPAFTVQTGTYSFVPSATSEYAGTDGYSNPDPAKPFDVVLTKHSTTEYYMQADWFNYGVSISFVCTFNSANKTLVWSGDALKSDGTPRGSSIFGAIVFRASSSSSKGIVFYGSGNSGKDPVVFTLDADGYISGLSSTSAFEADVFDSASGSWKWSSLWDAMGYGTSDKFLH